MSSDLKRRGFVHVGGDIWARFDGHNVWLESAYGEDTGRLIALEPETLNGLVEYISSLRKRFQAGPVPVWETLRRSVKREELRMDLLRWE